MKYVLFEVSSYLYNICESEFLRIEFSDTTCLIVGNDFSKDTGVDVGVDVDNAGSVVVDDAIVEVWSCCQNKENTTFQSSFVNCP